MAGSFDLDGVAAVGYFAAGVLCLYFGLGEHQHHRRHPALWPMFWFSTAVILGLLGFGQATDVGGVLAALGRRQAREEGWYDTRRTYQGLVVGALFAAWAIAVVAAVWRVPARRRRYVPAAVSVASLLCFDAVRTVSLHQIDAVLYRRDLKGVRVVDLAEWLLLALTWLAIWYGGTRPLPSRRRLRPR